MQARRIASPQSTHAAAAHAATTSAPTLTATRLLAWWCASCCVATAMCTLYRTGSTPYNRTCKKCGYTASKQANGTKDRGQ